MLTKELLNKLIDQESTCDLSVVTNHQLSSYAKWYQRLCILMHVPLDRKYTRVLDKQIESKKISYYYRGYPIDYSYYLAIHDLGYRSVYDLTFKEL